MVEPWSLAIGAVLGLGIFCGYGLAGGDEGTIKAKRVEIVDEAGNARIVLGMLRDAGAPGGAAYGICVRAAKPPHDRIEIAFSDQDVAAIRLRDAGMRDRIRLEVEPGPLGPATLRLCFPETGRDAVVARAGNTDSPSFELHSKDGTMTFSVPKK
jgi:hypothetical protein